MNRRHRPVLEELEPRILFSADLAALTGAHLLDTADVRPIAPTNSTNLANSVESGLVLAARHEVVFVDTSVDDWETLVGDIDAASGKNTLDVVLIDARRDGIDQISTALADRQAIDAIHIISHGSDGMLQLGTTQLDSTTLTARANQIQGWERALSSEADILLYGCDVARTADGQAFVARLGTLTGTDVAASSDKTGNAVQGGNWQFEYKVGSIETQSVAGATEPTLWSGTLAITSNGTVTSTQTTSATSLTWSHTVSAGSNRVLVVELAIDGLGAPASSVTYGGVALTQIGRGTGNHAVELWALINPTVGTANVVASFSGSTAAAGGASTFNGVAQTIGTAFGTFVSATGTGTTASVTASSAAGEQVIDVLYWRNSPATSATPGAGQTANWSQTNTTMGGGSSLEAGATSVVMSSNLSGSAQWEIAAVSMKTAAGITVTPTSGLTTTEAGGTANFSVVLDSAPTANVTIALSSSDSSEGTLSTGSLTFTTANWSTPQTVTVTGVDDSFIDGNIAYSIVTAAASSADARYNGLNASDVSLTNTDNDTVNTLYVDTSSDTVDGTVTSIASLLANKGADGKISLREAITAANNTANGVGGADVINFNIAGTGIHTINLASALPSITGAVTINAASDDSFAANGSRPAIVLNGGGSIQDGLDLVGGSDGSTIRGFIMQNFATVAIFVGTSNGNTIAGNWLGLDSAGTSAASNGAGIELWNANNNVVGGTTAADRNVISGGTNVGMAINTNNGTSTGNIVIGNYFGTNAAGTAAVGNTGQALWVNAANNTIGGATAGAGNVISGTTSWVGVQLTPSASGTLIAGNLIGLNAAGTAAIGNAGGGLYIESANNMIGGTTAASRNIISGNGLSGIDITGATATGNTVTGNYIGLNAAGTAAIANGETGVMIDTGASGNTIGGATASARNVISGNTQYGVIVTAQSGATANNIIQGNYLGTNAAGTVAVSNGGFGVVIDYAAINTSILDNVISGNTNTSWSASRGGIYLYANGATIQGNKIGLDATGAATLGNGGGASSAGIFEAGGSSDVLIGGTGAGQGNTITGNAGPGVVVLADPGNVRMLGNSIYGNTSLGIDLGNNGVTINDAGDGDSGANNLQNFPVLISATTNGSTIVVSGSFNSTASSYYRIEFFSSPSADSTGYGEGQTYLGYVNVSTNGSGNATFNTTLSASVAAGQYISATATQCNATYTTFTNTSEFAQNITSLAPNNAPSGANKTQTILEDTSHTFSIADFGFADPGDSPGNNLLTVTITTLPTAGSLTLSGAAVTASQSITAADITAGKLVFQPAANANGAAYASFTFQVQDDGGTSNGGVDLDPTPNTFTFNVTAVSDPPVNSVPGAQSTNEDTTKIFSSANGNAISITDLDAGGANNQVTLSVTHGTLTLASTGGLTFVSGDGTSDATMTLRGTASAINTALNGLSFSPTANYNGSATLTLATKDSVLLSLDIDTSLLGHYTFDSGYLGNDSSPAAGNMAAVVGATGVSDALRGNVVALDGSSNSNLQVSGLFGTPSNVTLAAWVNLTAADLSGAEVISLGDSVLLRLDAGGALLGGYYNGSTWVGTTYNTVLAGTGWHHVAFSFDDTANTSALYLDGALVSQLSTTDSISYTKGLTTFIGSHGDGQANFNFNGLIDEARIYNRALSATEIATLAADQTMTVSNTVTITVTPVNDAPNGSDKTLTILEDTSHTFSITDFGYADTSDNPANNLLAVTITTLPATGNLTLAGVAVNAGQSIAATDIATSKLVFTPIADANGVGYASFTFQVQDDGGTSNGGIDLDPTPNTVTFNITAVNDAPILADTALSLTVAEDAGVPSGAVGSLVSAFTGGFSDVDSGAVNGIALVASNETNGTWYYSTNGGTNWTTVGTVNAGSSLLLANNASTRLYFSPAANYNGSSSSALTFRAWDQTSGTAGTKVDTSTNGGTSAFSSTTDVIDVSVTPVNDAPVLTSNGGGATASVSAAENQTAVTTVTATDPDVGAVLTYSIAGGSDAGRFSIDANAGVLVFNFSPNFESTVDANADGVYEVIVAVADGSLSDTQALSVTVTNVNEAPTVVSLSNSTLPENTDTSAGTVVGSLTASDPDAADSTTYSIVGGADAGVFSLGGASSDQLVITHGVLDFETKSSYAVTVRVTDGGGLFHDQALLVSVSDVNEAPSFTSAALTTGTQDAAYSYTITTTDPDTGAVLSITAPTLPAWLTLTDHGDGTATLSGTPSNAEVGSHSVVLQVSDGTLTASQSFTLTVSNVNDAPVLTSNGGGATASVTAAENQTAVTTVTATDPDVGAVLTYSIAGGADAGRFSIDANAGVLTFNFSPDFESTVDANADGVYEVIVAVSDGSLSDTQALSVTVTNVNEAPTAGADTFTGNEDTSIIGNILSNDSDPDGDALNAVLVTGPSHGTLTLNGDGSFNYSAVANWYGNDSFSYQANDGTLNSAPTSVTLTVTPVNDSPVVSPITLGNLAEDNALLITQADLLAGASDVDGDALTAVNLALLGGNGALTDHGDGTWTFSPAANWSGAVSFSFAVSDGTTTVANAASLTVTAINDAPTSSPVTLAPIAEDSGAHLITQAALLANASDVDADVLTAGNLQISTGNGSLIDNGDGTWTYMPTANDDTAVSFSYTITDNGTSNGAADPKSIVATANLDLIPVNDAPISANGILNLAEDTPTSGQLPVASDAEGDPIDYALAAPASHGSVTVNADGSFDYLPAQNYNGSDSFMFSVSDNQGGSQNYRLDITVAPVNDAPTAANLVLNTQTNTVLNATLPAASDADGDPVSYGLVNPAGHGTVSVLSSGQFSYQPVANYSGPDSFTYSVSDGQGGTGAYSVTLNVSPAGAGIIVPPPPPPTEPSGSGPSTPGTTSTPPADSGNEGRTTGPQTTQIVPGRADPAITSSNRNDVAVASIKVKSIEPVATLIETTPSRLAGSRENPAPWTTDDISLEFLWKPTFRTIGTSAHAADGRVDFQPGQAVSDANRMQWLLDITPAKAAGVTLSVGVVWWTLRAGGLLASLAASLPVWRGIDVTMILDDRPLAAGKNNNGRREGGE